MVDPNSYRQIHLDFHTPGFVKVGERFHAKEFFDTLEESRVNSLVFFAKCHHGYSYFNTGIGTRHPGLSFDMLGEAAEEAAGREMDFLAYFSLNVDEVTAEAHPEWVALFKDGRPVDSQILQDGSELYWRWLCPNRGGYLDEFFFPHVEECLSRYPLDGIFIDMAGYLPGSCFCEGCTGEMHRLGTDPDDELAHHKFNALKMQQFAARLRKTMDSHRPGMRLEISCFNGFGEASGGRGVVSDFYVESLAFQTGWFNFPVIARYLRNFDLPVVGYTGRFLKNWGDFGTVISPHQLKTQLAAHLSAGASCGIGDHLHPSGALEPAVYSTIKEAFLFAEKRQPWCTGMTPAAEVGIIVPDGIDTAAACSDRRNSKLDIWDPLYGAAKLCMEGHYQWNVLTTDIAYKDLAALILIHPYLSAAQIADLRDFVERGGALIVDAAAVLPGSREWWEFIGIKSAKESRHPGAYYRIEDARLGTGLPEMAHYVHAPSVELEAGEGSRELAAAWYPPCARSREAFYGHFHGPDTERGGPAILCAERGKGRVIVLGLSVFAAYLNTGYHAHRTLLKNLLDSALPEKLVQTDAPSIAEITVGRKDGRTVIQIIPFVADRRHRYSFESVNEEIPIGGFQVRLRTERPVSRLRDPVSGAETAFTPEAGAITFRCPQIAEHLVLLAE